MEYDHQRHVESLSVRHYPSGILVIRLAANRHRAIPDTTRASILNFLGRRLARLPVRYLTTRYATRSCFSACLLEVHQARYLTYHYHRLQHTSATLIRALLRIYPGHFDIPGSVFFSSIDYFDMAFLGLASGRGCSHRRFSVLSFCSVFFGFPGIWTPFRVSCLSYHGAGEWRVVQLLGSSGLWGGFPLLLYRTRTRHTNGDGISRAGAEYQDLFPRFSFIAGGFIGGRL